MASLSKESWCSIFFMFYGLIMESAFPVLKDLGGIEIVELVGQSVLFHVSIQLFVAPVVEGADLQDTVPAVTQDTYTVPEAGLALSQVGEPHIGLFLSHGSLERLQFHLPGKLLMLGVVNFGNSPKVGFPEG